VPLVSVVPYLKRGLQRERCEIGGKPTELRRF
jgi:hypothetical protein